MEQSIQFILISSNNGDNRFFGLFGSDVLCLSLLHGRALALFSPPYTEKYLVTHVDLKSKLLGLFFLCVVCLNFCDYYTCSGGSIVNVSRALKVGFRCDDTTSVDNNNGVAT